jgi:hypothetical protein
MNLSRHLGLLLVPALLLGCSPGHNSVEVAGVIRLHDGIAEVMAPDHPNARISPDGDLSIDGKAVDLNDTQHDLIRQYYVEAYKLRSQGIQVGKAGAALAGQAIGSVAKRLSDGKPDRIDEDIRASAARIKGNVSLLCDSLDRLRATQNDLALQVPAFRPYAEITTDHIAQCRADTHHS